MAGRGNLFGKLSSGLRGGVRRSMNKVIDEIGDFETRGGLRGAVERARVRGERQAEKLRDFLDDRGINLARFVPVSPEEERALKAHYRTVGVPFGADLDTVKHAYRAKMREFHPDRHADDPVKEREATRISQDLTIAFDAIEAYLKGRPT